MRTRCRQALKVSPVSAGNSRLTVRTDVAARYGVRAARAFTRPNAETLTAIRNLVETGKVKPHVDAVLPLADVR